MLQFAKDRRTLMTSVAFALAAIAAMFLLIAPSDTHLTLLAVNGSRVLVPLLLPVAIALVAVLLRNQVFRVLALIVTGGVVVLGIASIGMFYLPAMIAMLVAVFGKEPSHETDV